MQRSDGFCRVNRRQNESGVLRGGKIFRGLFLTEVVGLTVITDHFLWQCSIWCAPRQEDNEINQQKYLKQPSNKGHAFPSVSERQGYVGDALCCGNEYNCESFSPVQYGS